MHYGSYRYTRATIDLDKLTDNYIRMKELLSPKTKFMGVIKADAYGHGAVEVGRHLESQNIDFLAVAVLDEAMELREAGVKSPILLLSPIEPDTIPTAIKNDISITVFSDEIAGKVKHSAESLQKKAKIHLKVDSGMARIGVRSREEAARLSRTMTSEWVEFEGIFTHFAEAENTEDPTYTKHQFDFFMDIVNDLKDQGIYFDLTHCSNTAATLLYPEYHLDMIRTGISLFGYHPDKSLEDKIDLQPVMRLSTHAAYVKKVEEGTTIGYGRTFTAAEEKTIATILLGYADGIPRELSNRWYLTTDDHKAPIVGRICMDQLMVDVSDIPGFNKDTELVFIGDPKKGHPSIYKMADLTDSFHYEILCGIGKRVPRVYYKNESIEAKHNSLLD
ncbi:alanine racemase [Alkalibacterium putridalgicola]|uniref:Alanine racemase n=1 Tax=Alkalibacterium putridalgicola TaxID=426703 RepID=A0A1H7UZL7_9LACT|nr:alanine racemase [Alkalibacterium putridalgicola]GEK89574.1 alanine racemase [Alkalibacterium putridalgicola]SEM02078.1 alanine racemase [Alkalibacterium putridalgicola]